MNKSTKISYEEISGIQDTLQENSLYWLFYTQNYYVVKISKIIEQKEIFFKEQEIEIIDNQIDIYENPLICEKKIPYRDKHLFKLFSKSQLDINSDNLLDIPDISYATLFYNLKLKLNKNNIIKAGKIYLGINLVVSNKDCYKKLLDKYFNLSFENEKNVSFIINGLPNTGKSELIRNFIKKIVNINFLNILNKSISINSNAFENNDKPLLDFSVEKFDKIPKKKFIKKLTILIELMDLFGNTVENKHRMNSSRYMRIIKFYYPKKKNDRISESNELFYHNIKFEKLKRIKFHHFLLEKNRILNQTEEQFYFHIVHSTIHGIYEILKNYNIDNKSHFFDKLLEIYPDYTNFIFENFYHHFDFIKELSNSNFHIIYKKNFFFENFKFSNENQNNSTIKDNDFKIFNLDSLDNSILNSSSNNQIENLQYNVLKNFFLQKFSLLLSIFKEFSFDKQILSKIFNNILLLFYFKDLKFLIDFEEKVYLNSENKNLNSIFSILGLKLEDEKKFFIQKLTSKEIISPTGSIFLIKYTIGEANREKNNLIKYLYENLFRFIEKLSNLIINLEYNKYLMELLKKKFKNLSFIEKNFDESNFCSFRNSNQDKNQINFIQLIECFGFENSVDPLENNLENLIINYSNDKINNIFFDSLVKKELDIYEKEGITNSQESNNNGIHKENINSNKTINNDILFNQLAKKYLKNSSNNDDNSCKNQISHSKRNSVIGRPNFSQVSGLMEQDIERTTLICEENSKGIFTLINSQSVLIKNSGGLLTSLINNIKTSWPEILVSNRSFNLNHIGCNVEYGGEDFILRNTDFVKEDLKNFFKEFYNNLVSHVIKKNEMNEDFVYKFFYKLINFSQQENNKNNIEGENKNQKKQRVSVIGRTTNSFRKKFHCENFLFKFKKIIASISNSDFSIIKLLKTGIEKDLESSSILDKNFINKIDNSNQYANNDIKNNLKIDESYVNNNSYIVDEIQNLNDLYKKKFYYEFDNKFFLKQIFSSGILESVLLTKSGYFFKCDFDTIKNKLKKYTNSLGLSNKIKKENNIKNDDYKKYTSLESNKLDFTNKDNGISDYFNWVPNSEFIEVIAKIISVKMNDIVLGKSKIFLKNRAILEKNNNHYFKLKDFPSLIIFGILKNILKKIKNVVKIIRYLKSSIFLKKVEKFNNVILKIYKQKKLNSFYIELNKIYRNFLEKIKIIQRKFRLFKNNITKIKKIQNNIKRFLKKKTWKIRILSREKIIKFIVNYYQKTKHNYITIFFRAFKNLINHRDEKVNALIYYTKIFLKKKNMKNFYKILVNIYVRRMKKIFLYKFLEKNINIIKLIKIQNFLRRILARKNYEKLKILNEKRRLNIENFTKIKLIKYFNKKILEKVLYKIKNFVEIKNIKANMLKKFIKNSILKKNLIKKNLIKKENFLKGILKLDKYIENNNKNAKKSILEEIIKVDEKNFLEKKNNFAIKITKILMKNKAIVRCKKLKFEKIEKEKLISNKFNIFFNKISKIQCLLDLKFFFFNLIQFNDNLLKTKYNVTIIQAFFRKKLAINNFKKRLETYKNIFFLISKIKKFVYNLKAKWMFKNIFMYGNSINEKNTKIILLQSLMRKKISIKKVVSLKEIIIKDSIFKNTLENFVNKIENFLIKKNNLYTFNKFVENKKINLEKEKQAIKLQCFIRKSISIKSLENLRKIETDNRTIFQLKLVSFQNYINNSLKNNNKNNYISFFNNLKNLINFREKCANILQKKFRDMLLKKNLKILNFQKILSNIFHRISKSTMINIIKHNYNCYLDKINQSGLKLQFFFRKSYANRIHIMLKNEKNKNKIIHSFEKIKNIFNNHSLESNLFLEKFKREFFRKLIDKYCYIRNIIRIQKIFRIFFLLKKNKKYLQRILKAVVLLENTFMFINLLHKNTFLRFIKEKYTLLKIFENEKKKKIDIIKKKIRQFILYKKVKEYKSLKIKRDSVLQSILIKIENKKCSIFLSKNFLKFKHNLKIRNILRNFCNKILKRFTILKYFKKIIFFTWKNSYFENKKIICLRKLFIRYWNLRNKKIKNDLKSILCVTGKYFINRTKAENFNSSFDENYKIVNNFNNIRNIVKNSILINKTKSTNNIINTSEITKKSVVLNLQNNNKKNLSKHENHIKHSQNEDGNNNIVCDNNSSISAKSLSINILNGTSKKLNSEQNKQIKVIQIEKIDKKNPLITKKSSNIENNFNSIEAKNSNKTLAFDSSFNEFDINEFKRFKFNKNILKGNKYEDDDEGRIFKYNAANILISKYSRASHKISAEIANERKIPFSSINLLENQSNYNEILKDNEVKISPSKTIIENYYKKLKINGRFSTINLNHSPKNILDKNSSFNVRNTINTKPNFYINTTHQQINFDDKNSINFRKFYKENTIDDNTKTSSRAINKELRTRNTEIPTYKDLIDMSSVSEFTNDDNKDQFLFRKSALCKNKKTLENSQNEKNNKNNKKITVKNVDKNNENLNLVKNIKNKMDITVNTKNEEIFNFNANKNKISIKTTNKIEINNDINKKVNFTGNNNYTRKDSSNNQNISERVDVVLKNLEKLTMLNENNISKNNNVFEIENKNNIEEIQNSNNYERVCISDYLNIKNK